MVGALEASGDIHVSAALFGEAGSGEHDVGTRSGWIGKNVAADEMIEFFEIFGIESGFLEEVFLENDEGLDFAGTNSLANGVEFGCWVVGTKNEARSRGIGIAISGDQFPVGLALTGNDGKKVGAEGVGDLL